MEPVPAPPVARGDRVGRLPLLPCLAFLLVAYAAPLAVMLGQSVMQEGAPTLAHFQRAFGDPVYLRVGAITFAWSLLVTVLCLLLGYPIAYQLSIAGRRTFTLLLLCVALPFSMSLLVRTYAWMILLGRTGVINSLLASLGLVTAPLPLLNNLFAVLVGMVQILLPYMILTLYTGMRHIDPDLLRAAASLGAAPWQGFVRVFVPLSLPGIGAGCLLVFILSVGFFIVPALLGGLRDVWIAQLIETQVNALLDWPLAAALGVTLLAVVGALYLVYERLLGLDRLSVGA